MDLSSYGSLPQTVRFLQSLASCSGGSDGGEPLEAMAGELLRALADDGFRLEALSTVTARNLRGLAESSGGGGGANVLALVMVAACIICAGLASGLTQVP